MSTEVTTGLPEQDVYPVISSVGNHEVKALLLGQMSPDVPYTQIHLRDTIWQMQGEIPVWKMAVRAGMEYCARFEGIGLVAEETVGPNAARAYRLTDRGVKLAKPLVGHLLDFSLNEEPSLLQVFGPTQTTSAIGRRPSEHRVNLMRYMLDREGAPSSLAKARDEFGLPWIHMISSAGEDLATAGILNRESSGYGRPTVVYMSGPNLESMTVRRDAKRLMYAISDILHAHFEKHPDEPISNADIAKQLIDLGLERGPLTPLVKRVSKKTIQLSNRGMLTPKRLMDDPLAREIISADADQLELMSKLLLLVDGIKDPTKSYLDAGRQKLGTILEDVDSISYLVQKAKDNSNGRKAVGDTQAAIREAISRAVYSSTTPLTVREVKDSVSETGIDLDMRTVTQHLNNFKQLGVMAVTNSSQGQRYLPVPGEPAKLEG